MISFLTLGFERTSVSIVGSIMYPFFITLTEPLARFLSQYVVFDNIVLLIIVTASLYGFAYGIIYKMGFDTGGSDIAIRIVNKYFHMSEGNVLCMYKARLFLLGDLCLVLIK